MNLRSETDQGSAGKQLMTASLNSAMTRVKSVEHTTAEQVDHAPSVENPQSFRIAFVSLSISPTSPNSSTSAPKGCKLVIGHRLMQAENNRLV